jgi:hypothetical protein
VCFNVIVNDIKTNVPTRFESLTTLVDDFGFVFEVSNLKMPKESLKYFQDLKKVFSFDEDCDFYCHGRNEELQVFTPTAAANSFTYFRHERHVQIYCSGNKQGRP